MYALPCQRASFFLISRALQTARDLPPRRLPNHRGMSSKQDLPSPNTNEPVRGANGPIIYSKNQPEDVPNRVSRLSAWSVSPSKMGLVRQFTFPTFAAAWRFMSIVAEECKAKRHHPSWHNLYNRVTVEWTTHKPEGLSIKDVEMAEFCDLTATNVGLQKQESTPTKAAMDKSTATSK